MSDGTGGEAAREGLFVALKSLLATSLAIGKTRAELLVTEVEEEKLRLMLMWAKAIAAAFFIAVGLVMCVILAALLFHEHRVVVFSVATAFFLGGGIFIVASLRRQMAQPSKLFRASLAELEEDMALLRSRDRP
jgi:uncharacterized membrane protein YqjE